jgi:peptidoglycan biosynthesis protein MviN/MurJ (putative lipid II flippase)
MVFMQLLKGCFSIALVMLTASLFGTGIDRDAWVIGWSVQVIVFKLLFGPINEIFRSRFLHLKEERGEPEALQSAYSLLAFLLGISLLLIVLFFVFRSELVSFFAPGYQNPAEMQVIEQMILFLIPTLILSELITIFTALLNSYQSFYLPEIFGTFSVLFNIILLLIVGQLWGIQTLVFANYLSSLILLLLLIRFLIKKGILIKEMKFSFRLILPYLVFSLPLYFSYTAGQLNAWVERVLVSYLPVGHTSALDYARKFIDMPVTIIITVGSIVMTPMLTAIWVKEKDSLHYQHNFFLFLRLGLLIISPIVLLFSVCSKDIVELLLHRGNFSADMVQPTADTLRWFGLGLYGVVFYSISGQALLVQKKSVLYAFIGIFCQLIPVVINYYYYRQYDLRVFGMSWCIAQFVCGLLMFLSVRSFYRPAVLSLLLLLFILIINLIGAYYFLSLAEGLSSLVRLGLTGIASLIIVLVLMKLFGLDEFDALKKLFSKTP